MPSSSIRAAHLRKAQTGAEAKLWQALRGRRLNGWKFRRQSPIDRFIVDFVCHDAKLLREVDGATHGSADKQARDKARTLTLEACGSQVLRVTNADVFENLDGVRETILAAIEEPGAD